MNSSIVIFAINTAKSKHQLVFIKERTPIQNMHFSRLSTSELWQRQRDRYAKLGPASWSQKGVPFQITSNALLAKQYAEVALEHLMKEHVQFLELGGGSGKFAYLFLQELLPRIKEIGLPPVRYTLTDLAEKNVLFWQSHPLFTPYLESGVLEMFVYNPLVSPPNFLKDKPFVIANYFFDSIEQDLFRVEEGKLFEGRIALTENEREEYTYHPIENSDYYPDLPELNEVLDDYRKQLNRSTFLIPIGAIQTLRRLSPCFLLAGDKGFSTLDELSALSHPELVRHETFSFPVNFHAIGEYVRKMGNYFLSPRSLHPVFSVHGFSSDSEDYPSFYEQFNGFCAQDLFERQQLSEEEWLSLLPLSNWDPSFFLGKIELLKDVSKLRETLEKIERRFFPICQEEALLGHNFEHLFEKLGQFDRARTCRERLASFQMLPRLETAEVFLHGAKLSGHVLQIGEMQGVGEAIQAFHPKSYKMIPLDLEELKTLGVFDQIFLFSPGAPSKPVKQFSSLLVSEGQKIIRDAEQKISYLMDIVYTDQDLDHFFSSSKKSVLDPVHYLHFFLELAKKKQITAGQFHRVRQRLVREGMVAKEEAKHFTLQEEIGNENLFFEIVQQCLTRHMQKGSEFKGCFHEAASQLSDVRFSNEIVSNPQIDYREEVETVAGRKFLFVTIRKYS